MARRSLIRKLEIPGEETLLSLATAGGGQTQIEKELEVRFRLRSLNRKFTSHTLTATTCKHPLDPVQRVTLQPGDYSHLRGVSFSLSYPQKAETVIHLILDTNNCLNFWEGEIIGEGTEGPKVIQSRLGNILAGSYLPTKSPNLSRPLPCSAAFPKALHKEKVSSISDVLSRFWDLEHIGILPVRESAWTEEEEEAERMMKRVTSYDRAQRRFTTELLFKRDPSCLPKHANLAAAKAMALSSYRRHQRAGTLKEVLNSYQEKLDLGFAEIITDPAEIADLSSAFYAPTHAVVKPSSTTFKVRVVQNSSHAPPGGHSLNSILHKGRDLMPSLLQILVRYRCFPTYVSSDISRQFWRISISQRHKDFMRYMFVNGEGKLTHCRSLSLAFGLASSSYQSMWCLHDLASIHQTEYPKAAHVCHNSLYQDDAGFGTNCEDDAVETATQLYNLMLLGSFPTHKWCSSRQDILKRANIPEENWAKGDSISFLGLNWLFSVDQIHYDFRHIIQPAKRFTLREMCSTSARIFDPLGHLCACTTLCKLFFRRAVEANVTWDDDLPPDIKADYLQWRHMIKNHTPFSIPRPAFVKGQKVFMACMSDASKDCYACAIYAVSPSQVRLIVAKSRITPLRGKNSSDLRLTIPRLEMMSIECASSLAMTVKDAMPANTFEDIFFFTDSRISVLRLQNGPEPYKIFIASRIRRILSRTPADHIYGVGGNMNPTDAPSRGRTMNEIMNDDLWWRAPLWLRRPKNEWPIHKAYTKEQCKEMEAIDAMEIAKTSNVCAATTAQFQPLGAFSLLEKRITRFIRLQRITAYILRFLLIRVPSLSQKCVLLRGAVAQKGPLKVSELRTSAKLLYRVLQLDAYRDQVLYTPKDGISLKVNSALHKMGAYVDADQLIRVKTRLELSAILDAQSRNPILLPRPVRNTLGSKIILSVHETNLHAGPSTTLFILQKTFHVTGGLKAVAYCINKGCGNRACYKLKRPDVATATLPTDRSHAYLAWDSVATDVCGPFQVLVTPTQLATKAWCVLFVCQITRATHTEVVTDLSTETFLLAFRRHVSLKGVPSTIWSDSAKSYLSANRKLAQLYRRIDQTQLEEEASKRQCQWRFSIPECPSSNGCTERLVGSIKKSLVKTMAATSRTTLETLTTLLLECCAIVNSRPLCRPETLDKVTVTPALLTQNRDLSALPFESRDSRKVNKESKFSKMNLYRKNLICAFWRCWRRDFLMRLRVPNFQKQKEDIIHVGDIVIVFDKDTAKGKWKLARVRSLRKSADGITRRVTLDTPQNTVIDRHLKDLALFEEHADTLSSAPPE